MKRTTLILDRKAVTIFGSTGLAIQNLAMADLVYRIALKRNVGRKINLLGL